MIEEGLKEYLSLQKAIKEIGIGQDRILRMIENGDMKGAYKEGWFWRIPITEIERIKGQENEIEDFSTVEEVAKIIKRHPETIKNWIRDGFFPNAVKWRNAWMIPKSDVETLPECEQIDAGIIKKAHEITGKKYGELTILKVLGYRYETKTAKRLFVRAGCECGEIVEKPFYIFETGRNKYCSNQCMKKSGFELGDRYGFLTIIDDAGLQKLYNSKNNKRFVKAKCDCGKIDIYPLPRIKGERQMSCGKGCSMWLKNIVGEKHGFLTVLRESTEVKERRWFDCECECGKIVSKEMSKLINGHTKFCGKGCPKNSGENHHSWNPDKTDEERLQGRDYWEYNQWRKAVYKRDEYTCQCCGKVGGSLEAHHKDAYHWCRERRTDVSNGVTVCLDCHNSFHYEYGNHDNTEKQFEEWLENKKQKVSL